MTPQPVLEGLSLRGKTCLVTGATSGHGLAVAHWLARLGADLVLLGRSPERCREAQQAIARQSGARPELLLCDLASASDVACAARSWLEQQRPLHVLINNAGLVSLKRQQTADGVELTFGVNVLAHFQLTLALWPSLLAAGGARVINVSSDMHRVVSLRIDDLQHQRTRYSLLGSYGRSKLALLYLTLELSRRAQLGGQAVTVNAMDPGPVESRIGQNNPGRAADLLLQVMRYGFPEADWAARTAVWLAAAPELAGRSGGYYKFGEERQPRVPDAARLGRELWLQSAELLGPRCPTLLPG